MYIKNFLVIISVLPFAALACNVQEISVHDATVLAGPPGQTNTAGYARITNAGKTTCEIVSANGTFERKEIAKKVELHTVSEKAGMMKMEPVKEFIVPAHGELLLAPGGNHLMFMTLAQDLKPKEQVEITLKFKHGEEKKITAIVQDMREAPKVQDHSGH